MSSSSSANDADFDQLGVRECAPLPLGLPKGWYDAPLRVGVGLILTEHNCVHRSFFDDFSVASVPEAIEQLFKCEGVFLCYNFFMDGVVPAFAHDADWPLMRRGSREPTLRTAVQADEPWSWCWDRTLFEIRNEPVTPWSSRTYLRAGGRTSAQATMNWNAAAKVFRPYLRSTRNRN